MGVGSSFDIGLMSIFMEYGPIACAAGCGSVFLGTSFFLIGLFLRPEEYRKVQHLKLLNVTVLAALSYGVLMILGAEGGGVEYLFWIVGAITGGRIFLEFGSRLSLRRRKLAI